MATYMPKKQDVPRQWLCIDAEGKTLGRLAVEIAGLLRGKGKPQYSPHVDCGDFVVVVNAAKIEVSGEKGQQIVHYRHSGYPGGLKRSLLADELARHPDRVLVRAVRGMMPKNRLSRQMLRKLKVYAGPEHPHHAQFAGEPGEPGQGKNRRKKKKPAVTAEPEPAKRRSRGKPKAKPAAEEAAVDTDAEIEANAAEAEAEIEIDDGNTEVEATTDGGTDDAADEVSAEDDSAEDDSTDDDSTDEEAEEE